MAHILNASIIALALTAGAALAQPPAPTPPANGQAAPNRQFGAGPGAQNRPFADRLGNRGLGAIDADGDGLISKNEWTLAGRKPARFDMMDLNKDGKLDRQEIASARGAVRADGGANPGQPGAGQRGFGGGRRQRDGLGGQGALPLGGTPAPAAPTS